MWLAESTRFSDITHEFLLRQYVAIAYYTKGGFSYETVSSLPFRKYKIVLDEVKKVKKVLETEDDSEG